MKLIADAGGTTTEWRLIDGDRIEQFQSDGFNFKTHPLDPFLANLPEEIINLRDLEELYFYGAGITNDIDAEILSNRFQLLFPGCSVSTYSDTLGVARSIFGSEKGFACLLGTGSGAAYYNGTSDTERIPSLGFIIGDEGSGFTMGKALLTAKIRQRLPEDLNSKFDLAYPNFEESDLIQHVYSKPKANLYVADFASFLIENQSSPYAYRLIENELTQFFESFFPNKEENANHRFRFCGSIAHYTSNILRRVAPKFNVAIDLIAQSPIAGLTLYHQNND